MRPPAAQESAEESEAEVSKESLLSPEEDAAVSGSMTSPRSPKGPTWNIQYPGSPTLDKRLRFTT